MTHSSNVPPVGLIGVGTNVGPRRERIAAAQAALVKAGLELTAVSSIVSSVAVGGPPGQKDYANAVFRFESRERPETILERLLDVEVELGRDRSAGVRWSARTIDLDLLLLGDVVVDSPRLRLPHPLMPFRPFVLQPAREVAGERIHPVAGVTVDELVRRLRNSSRWLWVDREVLASHHARLSDLVDALKASNRDRGCSTAPAVDDSGTGRVEPAPGWIIGTELPDRSGGAGRLPRATFAAGLSADVHAATFVQHPEFGPLPALPLPGRDPMVNEQLAAVLRGTETVLAVLSPSRTPLP